MSLQGTLSTLGITELLELLALRDASGQLDVNAANGTASYLFLEGKVSLAEFNFARGMGEDPAEATYYVLAAEDGEFYYEPQEVEGVPEGEAVDDILKRSEEVGGRWDKVEEVIPTVSHIICRNSQLDSSVTIEPEWWNILEVLGSGKSSTQVAADLEVSTLDASTRLLEMVDAGLLVATDDVVIEEAPVEEVAVEQEQIAEAPVEEVAVAKAPVAEASVEEAMVEDMAAESAPVQEMSFSNPVEDELVEDSIVPIEQANAPVLGFSNHGEPTAEEIAAAPMPPITEPVPEPVAEIIPDAAPELEQEVTPTLGYGNAESATPEPEAAVPTFGATDEGWSKNPFGQEFDAGEPQAFVEADPISEVVPVIEEAAPMPEPSDDASEIFGLDSNFHDAPIPEAAPTPEAMPTPEPAPVDAPAVADEVMNDLSYLNDDLDHQLAAQPAPQAVPEASPPAQASPVPEMPTPTPTPQLGEQDPFGSLSDLVVEGEAEEDRSSVLKFLRRD